MLFKHVIGKALHYNLPQYVLCLMRVLMHRLHNAYHVFLLLKTTEVRSHVGVKLELWLCLLPAQRRINKGLIIYSIFLKLKTTVWFQVIRGDKVFKTAFCGCLSGGAEMQGQLWDTLPLFSWIVFKLLVHSLSSATFWRNLYLDKKMISIKPLT